MALLLIICSAKSILEISNNNQEIPEYKIEEIRNIISDSYDRCKNILTEHIDKLNFVAEFLLKNESMDEEQFVAAMEAEAPVMEEIEAIETARKRRSEEENKNAYERNLKREAEQKAKEEAEAKREGAGLLGDDFFASVWDSAKATNEGASGAGDTQSSETQNQNDKTEE